MPNDPGRLVYLATPYSHPDPAVREARFVTVNRVAARLMASGILIFSPISHTHPICLAGELPSGWQFWQAYDRAALAASERLIVLRQQGWEDSIGVTGEVEIAREFGLHVAYIDPLPEEVAPPLTETPK